MAEEAADCEGEAEGAGAGVVELVWAGRMMDRSWWKAGYGFAGYTGMKSYSIVNRSITSMYLGLLSLVKGLASATRLGFKRIRNLDGSWSALRGPIIIDLIPQVFRCAYDEHQEYAIVLLSKNNMKTRTR